MPSNASTQANIPIAGMKDGILILRNGEYRIILELTAINFDLKSEQEQNAIIFQYQSFLNSLHHPLEIVVQSKKLDLSPYLKKIKDLAAKQTNELIKIQTVDYVDFVEQLINLANIMKKQFYVSIGFAPLVQSNSIIDKLLKRDGPAVKLKINEQDFANFSKELRQRAQSVAQGLGAIGLRCRQLNTQEVIELLYELYNPEIAGKERLTDSGDISGSYVTQMKPLEPNQDATTSSQGSNDDTLIDNKAVVTAQQKEKNREIALENSKVKEPEKQDNELDAVQLPGEKPPEAVKTTAASASQDESYDNSNYGS